MKTYFAHWVGDYGTDLERRALASISAHGRFLGETVNPNTAEHGEAYSLYGMGYFVGVVAVCDACVFMRMPCGSIGAGVAMEVARFFHRGKPVFEVDRFDGSIDPVEALTGRILTVEETRWATHQARAAREAA